MARAASAAFRFVFVMGIVNLFADMTYEGGGSIDGPFLGSLGASPVTIAIIAGLGEFLGYAVRIVSRYVADRTGKHWPIRSSDTRSTCSPSRLWCSLPPGSPRVRWSSPSASAARFASPRSRCSREVRIVGARLREDRRSCVWSGAARTEVAVAAVRLEGILVRDAQGSP
jgi:hypothetical protein